MPDYYSQWLLDYKDLIWNFFRRYSLPRWLVFFVDNILVLSVFFLAYLLRFNFVVGDIDFSRALIHALIVLIIYGANQLIFRSYAGLIRHTTLTDISLILVSTTTSALILIGLSALVRTFGASPYFIVPFSVILIHYGLVTLLLFIYRIAIKLVFRFATSSGRKVKNVVIYGAGDLGFIVKRVIMSDPGYGYNVAGFIETNKTLVGKKINSIPVHDPGFLNPKSLARNKIRTIILAIKDITIEEKSRIIRSAINLGLEVLETPEIQKWMNGQLNTNQFQRVKLEDLLGREQIQLNLSAIREGLNNKTILVTGAAGSIGSEIVRQLTRFNCKKVILVDQSETPVFNIQNELMERFSSLDTQIIIADVTNPEKMEQIFRDFRPDVIFHAAAYKHVSLMEDNPHESIRVNVGGTKILADLAVKYDAEKFVMISTDKSVNPTGVMGASKRICEKVVQAAAQQAGDRIQFVITRFGNVLGSNGSVVPVFSKQIESGGPVKVTHPEVTRYFMTIPEACQLVLEAGFMGKGGEIFVFDMGNPVKIVDLAEQMIRLSGYVPGKDIKIVFTGLRPGEKLFEELLTDKEITIPTHHPKINKAKVETISKSTLSLIDELINNLYSFSKKEVVGMIHKIVPEYQCSNNHYSPQKAENK